MKYQTKKEAIRLNGLKLVRKGRKERKKKKKKCKDGARNWEGLNLAAKFVDVDEKKSEKFTFCSDNGDPKVPNYGQRILLSNCQGFVFIRFRGCNFGGFFYVGCIQTITEFISDNLIMMI